MVEFHPIANVFPLMEGAEFAELVADIRTNGLREPIVMFEGKILDGRNRYRACTDAGVGPDSIAYDGTDPVGYVVSLNLRRRHLDESQRGMVAGKIATLKDGQRQVGKFADVATQSDAAKMLNVSERTVRSAREVLDEGAPELVSAVESGAVSVSAAADVACMPRERQREIVAKGEKEILEAAKTIRAEKAERRRAERIERIETIAAGNAPLIADRRFSILLADPAWKYENPPVGDSNRSIENHYPTMDLDEICALPVAKIAADDALLYLWATAPKLPECLRVMEAWGFEYRTHIVWVKDRIGTGYHARNKHELLLIGRRGEMPPPRPGEQPPSVIEAPRGEHSEKPAVFAETIERLYPEVGKIELFCRFPRAGWSVWGNQSGAA